MEFTVHWQLHARQKVLGEHAVDARMVSVRLAGAEKVDGATRFQQAIHQSAQRHRHAVHFRGEGFGDDIYL